MSKPMGGMPRRLNVTMRPTKSHIDYHMALLSPVKRATACPDPHTMFS
jgi:hypothetical protein